MENGTLNPGVRVELLAEVECAEHFHQEVELLFVMEGTMTVREDDHRLQMRQDDILIVNAGRRHALRKGERALVCLVRMPYRLLCDYVGHDRLLLWCNSMQDSDNSYQELRQILQELLLDYMNGQESQYFARYALYYRLLHFIANHYVVKGADLPSETREQKNDARLADIQNYIEQNFRSDISLQQMADHLYLSNAYLSKYIKRKLGMNFVDFISAVRLAHAIEDLLYTDQPVTRVALDNGFASVATFNKLFKDKHGDTPSGYRAKMRNAVPERPVNSLGEDELKQRLRQHFGVEAKSEWVNASDAARVEADGGVGEAYHPTWNRMMNAGAAKTILGSAMQQQIALAKKELGIEYVRFWSVFDAEMYTARSSGAEPINFGKLDSIIDFLLEQRLTPFIELGEKPERIQASPMHAVLEPRNTTLFTRYPEFLQALDQMFAHLVQRYGISEVEKWVVELWDDHRVEVYQDKQTYARLFKDVRGIVKAHVPGIRLGGAGNHLGWHKSDTTDGIRRWIDEGIYPDFISYDYYPYAAIGEMSEKFSKRKTNPDDFRETLDELRRSLLEYGFPGRKLFITDWNSTVSQRNVLNDSCWKACWLLKNAIDTLGQADMIAYSQISDITGDYYDAPLLLSGMAGLLTKEGIRKPAYYAMRFLAKMLPQMVSRGEHYLITRDESGRYAIALHNFKPLNYLWYMKEENAIPLAEQYRYFDDLSGAQLDVVLRNMESGRYVLRKSTLNRKHGSVADEWAQMNCFEQLRREDIDYLRGICAPHVTLHSYRVKDGTLTIPVSMQPLEISLIEVLPEK